MTTHRFQNPLRLFACFAEGMAAARRMITEAVLPMPSVHPAVSDRRIDSF